MEYEQTQDYVREAKSTEHEEEEERTFSPSAVSVPLKPQQSYNKILVAEGDKPLTKWQWYEVVEKKRRIEEGYGERWRKTCTHTRNMGVLLL